ncbi:IS4 family transposase [Pseudoalteromonas sp. NCIMB_1079]|uniref:IS4 family transposase n=1 Tax=Pseudoalteromonas sp. NCIMB 1079 TaxID=3142847 RepID=UPI00339D148E
MPETSVCHKYFKHALAPFNNARVKTLLSCSNALISGNKLTLTEIGRNLSGAVDVKHKIKRVDRFLKNTHLYNERVAIYEALAHPIIDSLPMLAIAVDWSGACGHDYHLLRASLLVDGRSIVIYNMIVEQKDFDSPATNSLFLDEFYEVLGRHPSVYIVTDGGFLTPWYSKVRELGWHMIGRLRGSMKCKLAMQSQWHTLKQLRAGASDIPKALGQARLTQSSPAACDAFLHVYHGKNKGRKGKSRFTKDTKMYQNLAKEPWLLATSDNTMTSKRVVGLYSKRMQIEQNFRDDKSLRYGFSWRFSKSTGINRIGILCLIATIASTALWFIGCEAEKRKWHIKFQANSVKNRRVLSFLTLAKQVIKLCKRRITQSYIEKSLKNFILNYEKEAAG